MSHSPAQRPLLCLLAALIGLTSATTRDGAAVLCVATGDHHHVAIEGGHGSGACHTVVHDHDSDNEHEHDHEHAGPHGAAAAGVVNPTGAHEHACLDIRLPAGDLRLGGKAHGDVHDAVAVTPAVPVVVRQVSPRRPQATPWGYDTHPPGLAPPDLLRSTILLI